MKKKRICSEKIALQSERSTYIAKGHSSKYANIKLHMRVSLGDLLYVRDKLDENLTASPDLRCNRLWEQIQI